MMDYLALWWVWVCAALALGLIEILVPGFIFLGFALGALGMAAVIGAGLAVSTSAKLALFAILSLIGWVVLRRVYESPKGSVKIIEDDIND